MNHVLKFKYEPTTLQVKYQLSFSLAQQRLDLSALDVQRTYRQNVSLPTLTISCTPNMTTL